MTIYLIATSTVMDMFGFQASLSVGFSFLPNRNNSQETLIKKQQRVGGFSPVKVEKICVKMDQCSPNWG